MQKEITLYEEVKAFIKRRFPDDCSWTTGNCYYFAIILKARFSGAIFYDVVDGHFVVRIDSSFYDHTGLAPVSKDNLVEWDKFEEYDKERYWAIVRDCIM